MVANLRPGFCFRRHPSAWRGLGKDGFLRMASKLVMVVEDEGLLRWSLVRRLDRAGYRTCEAGSGQEASRAPLRDVDLILLDIRLPDADGLGLLKSWRADGVNCPVIMMSAYATAERVDEATGLGAVHVAHKPFDLDRFVGVVDSVLA